MAKFTAGDVIVRNDEELKIIFVNCCGYHVQESGNRYNFTLDTRYVDEHFELFDIKPKFKAGDKLKVKNDVSDRIYEIVCISPENYHLKFIDDDSWSGKSVPLEMEESNFELVKNEPKFNDTITMKNKYEYVLEQLNELLEGINDNNDYRFEYTSTGWVDDIMFNGVLLYDSEMDAKETATEILDLCKIRLKKLREDLSKMNLITFEPKYKPGDIVMGKVNEFWKVMSVTPNGQYLLKCDETNRTKFVDNMEIDRYVPIKPTTVGSPSFYGRYIIPSK